MFSKEMTYTDYNGNERNETLYFNINAAELAKLQATTNGGLQGYIKMLFEEQDIAKIWDLFETIVRMSYGKKMPDGSFAKSNGALADKFVETKVYADFMVWLLSDAGKNASAFVNAIIPEEKDLPKELSAPAGNVVPLNP